MGLESDDSIPLSGQSAFLDSGLEATYLQPVIFPSMTSNFRSLIQARNSLEFHKESLLGDPKGTSEVTKNPHVMSHEWYETLERYDGPGCRKFVS